MSETSKSYCVHALKTPFVPYEFELHPLGDYDVEIKLTHCGVCHSDIHNVDGEWGEKLLPLVPGHEIIGIVTKKGAKVTKFDIGQRAGVGPQHISCGKCIQCTSGHQNYCVEGFVETYGSKLPDGYVTKGGYSRFHRVHEDFAIAVPEQLPSAPAAPLLCAGITVYTPLKYLNVGPGKKVGIVGIGGLGHLAIKIAAAMGAEVTAISTSPHKEAEAKRFGAKHFLNSTNPEHVKRAFHSFDVILNSTSAPISWDMYLDMLVDRGHFTTVGNPNIKAEVSPGSLIFRGLNIHGTLIGSPPEQAEMLAFCAKHNILPDIEVVHWSKVNEAVDRVRQNTVKFRMVLEIDDNHEL